MDVETQSREKLKGGWRSAFFIIFVEMGERFAYYGISGNLMIYLTKVIEQPTATAAKNVNVWNGVSFVGLLAGAFFADSYVGRFKTTLLASSIFLLGLILMTISSSPITPHHMRTTLLFTALYITALGEGGHKPCVQTFAADQFDEETPEEKKSKSSFFNWWFLGIGLGATSGTLIVTYIDDKFGWTVGFTTPAVAVAVAVVVFVIGSRTYREERPVGSPFTRVAQVVVAALRKRRVSETRYGKGICQYEVEVSGNGDFKRHNLARTREFRCLDKATIIDDLDDSNKTRNPWRLCSVNQVEEVKLLFRLIPIWVCTFAYAIIIAQSHTFFLKQANTMNRRISSKYEFPPAYLQVITGVGILLAVPVYDKILIPTMRKFTNIPTGITVLQRIGIGLALSVLSVAVAALVEAKRLTVARNHGIVDEPNAKVPMVAWWLIPQFVIMGFSDLFAYVGMQELFYVQMPEDWRSIGSAFTNGSIGVGNLISAVIISIVQHLSSRLGTRWLVNNLNRAHLNDFYWLLAGIGTLNLVVYVLLARRFVWKKTEGDQDGV